MSRKLYISDLHFGHEKAIYFDKRPFFDVEEMDQKMMDYWNESVDKDDEVYVIGDFQFRSFREPEWYLKRLSGKKFLILGNHDIDILKSRAALKYFEEIEHIMNVNDNGRQLCLCHFPLVEWDTYYRGGYHLYGHIHGNLSETCLIMRSRINAYNVSACINNYRPSTLGEIIENNKRFIEETPLQWRDFPTFSL